MTANLEDMAAIATNWRAADLSSLSILLTWYEQQTGEKVNCPSCEGERARIMSQIIRYISMRKNNGMKVTSQFKLKSNNAYPVKFGSSEFISNANMTDEKAIAFLSENPNRIQIFAEVPESYVNPHKSVEVKSEAISTTPPKIRKRK
jgi:hypothetical protein